MGRYGCTVFVIVLLSAIVPSGAFAQAADAPWATGLAYLDFGGGTLGTVSFTATGLQDGAAFGQIDIDDPVPIPDQDVDGTGDPTLVASASGVILNADVNCLAVDGDTAIVGGLVTRSDVARYVGKQVLLFVEDSARSHGWFSWGFYEPQGGVFCGSFPRASYTPVEIAGGTLQVHP
jgi:hypothetical protein